jgi:hypothetical protein
MSDGIEIVQQPHRGEVERLAKGSFVNHPWQIGDPGLTVRHWTGDAKARRGAWGPSTPENLLHDCLETGVLGTREGRLCKWDPRTTLGRKECEISLRPADIAGQQYHEVSSPEPMANGSERRREKQQTTFA